jgi:hypothetical protein
VQKEPAFWFAASTNCLMSYREASPITLDLHGAHGVPGGCADVVGRRAQRLTGFPVPFS